MGQSQTVHYQKVFYLFLFLIQKQLCYIMAKYEQLNTNISGKFPLVVDTADMVIERTSGL